MLPLVNPTPDNGSRKALSLKIFQVIFSRPVDSDIEHDAMAHHNIRKQIDDLDDRDTFTSKFVDDIG
jgi:hypothetical protein